MSEIIFLIVGVIVGWLLRVKYGSKIDMEIADRLTK